jgi:N-carbamoylputrescine amidase
MTDDSLTLALITELFHDDAGGTRLLERLCQAKEGGAELAVLPELPLNAWAPATREVREEDAEPPKGPRHWRLSEAARKAEIGVMGGAIVRDPATGHRHNTALVFDARGNLAGSYRKAHLPEEEGFWETSHYRPGDELPEIVHGFSMHLGIQICSDVNRPEGTHLLGAMGAEVVLAPRATPRTSTERWLLVMRANAVTSGLFVVSTNRPGPEAGVSIGGPSVAIAPDGEVLVQSEEALAIACLDRGRLLRAGQDYPGYLPVRADLYAEGWSQVAGRRRERPDPA